MRRIKTDPAYDKVKSLREIVKIARRARAQGKKVVTTNGCFDILHVGHVKNLNWAKHQGGKRGILIVGVNSDASVRAIKGPKRPIVHDKERAQALAGLEAVDYVFVFNTERPIPWMLAVKPTIHVKGKGSEKSPFFKPEEDAVKKGGGKIVLAPLVPGYSTTKIIEIISKRYGK